MKIGTKELGIIAFAGGLLALVLVVMLVYMPYKEQTEMLQSEIQTLEARKTELQGYKRDMERYDEENKLMIEDINYITDQFPADSLEEDAILFASTLEGRNSNTFIGSMGMEDPELVYAIEPTSVYLSDDDKEADIHRSFNLYRQKVTMAYNFSYLGMKQFVTDIVGDNRSRTIEALTLRFDPNSGFLEGEAELNLYTLEGTDDTYTKQEIFGIPTGTNDIFGSMNSPSEVSYEGPMN